MLNSKIKNFLPIEINIEVIRKYDSSFLQVTTLTRWPLCAISHISNIQCMKNYYSRFRSLFNSLIIAGVLSPALTYGHTGGFVSSKIAEWNQTTNFNEAGPSLVGFVYANSGLTFEQVSPGASSQMAVLSFSNEFITTTGPDPSGTDRGLLYNLDNNGSTLSSVSTVDFRFKSSDKTEFKLSSMEADMGAFQSENGYRFTLTVTGFRDGLPVASDNIDFTSSDAIGSVSYTKSSVEAANGGMLTFSAAWQNIDEIRFTGGDNSTIRVLMIDDIALLPAVTDVLPVTLVKFTSQNDNDQAELSWETSMETNFSHFEIEKSLKGKSFFNIGSVAPKSNGIYQYFPMQNERQAYYRLKMVDKDGSFGYSRIVSVFLKEYASLAVIYPNPAQAYINVKSSTVGTFLLYNGAGHQVLKKVLNHGDNKIEIQNLATGMYYGLSNGQSLKFVKE